VKVERALARDTDKSKKELEVKLSAKESAIASLEEEVVALRQDANNLTDLSSTADGLREKLARLEKSVRVERALSQDSDKALGNPISLFLSSVRWI
jgi:uncharacterized membrane protein